MSTPFIGEIKSVAFNFPPRGYSSCAGQILSIAQNTALFSLLGTTYGGNGQVTFGLPNLQSRVPVGQGEGAGLSLYELGEMGGAEAITLLQSQMPMHTHMVTSSQQSIPAAGSATGNISIPAQNGGAATNTPSPSTYLGKPGAPAYAAASNTTLAPFPATLDVSVTIPSANLGLQNSVAGGNLPFEILPPYLAINYIIALVGIFPSRN